MGEDRKAGLTEDQLCVSQTCMRGGAQLGIVHAGISTWVERLVSEHMQVPL